MKKPVFSQKKPQRNPGYRSGYPGIAHFWLVIRIFKQLLTSTRFKIIGLSEVFHKLILGEYWVKSKKITGC